MPWIELLETWIRLAQRALMVLRAVERGESCDEALQRMNALTLEVILRVVFGVTDERRLAALRPRVNATVDINPVIMLALGGAARVLDGLGGGS